MSLTEAAKWAGKSRATIWKAIKAGRISGEKDEKGEIRINPAELERVYKPARQVGGNVAGNVSTEREEIAIGTAVKDEEIAGLRVQIALLKDSLEDARQQRDRAMQTADRLTLVLQDQSQKPPAVPAKRSWLQRLTGAKQVG